MPKNWIKNIFNYKGRPRFLNFNGENAFEHSIASKMATPDCLATIASMLVTMPPTSFKKLAFTAAILIILEVARRSIKGMLGLIFNGLYDHKVIDTQPNDLQKARSITHYGQRATLELSLIIPSIGISAPITGYYVSNTSLEVAIPALLAVFGALSHRMYCVNKVRQGKWAVIDKPKEQEYFDGLKMPKLSLSIPQPNAA